MADKLNIHDLSIIGITYNKIKNDLIFNIDDNSMLIFHDIFHWDLTPFETQNIIFEISIYKKPPNLLINDYGLKKEMPIDFNLYHINSSAGLSGVIISKKLEIIKNK